MLDFPENLYSDVRVEDVLETRVVLSDAGCLECREGRRRAAFLRVFDGRRWYYESTSSMDRLQELLDELATLARPDPAVGDHPVVRALEVNRGRHRYFEGRELDRTPLPEKRAMLEEHVPLLEGEARVRSWQATYMDQREARRFASSLGADLDWDTQRAGISLKASLADGPRTHVDHAFLGGQDLESVAGRGEEAAGWMRLATEFLLHAKPVRPGKYTTLFSPAATGVFAHECFGHKSEADFMVGDDEALAEWSIGRKIGTDILSIAVNGAAPSVGFVPFDDEGSRGREVLLIREGHLAGRLHSASTAAALGEAVTGNGRAVDYRYEPIPRQTNTYVLPGEHSREELLGEVSDGIYVDNFLHGSGMSTFTIAPCRAYRVVKGRLADPVRVAVVTGQVFEALAKVDGVSDELEIMDAVGPGCGKMEQMGLPVAFGGPVMRVRDMGIA